LAGEIAGQMPELSEGVGRVVRGGEVKLDGVGVGEQRV